MEQRALSPLVARTADSLAVTYELDGTEYRASLSAAQGLGPGAESLIALGLLPAMRAGRRLRLPDAVSPRLLSAVPEIQNIYHAWDQDRFERVDVEARTREERPPAPVSAASSAAAWTPSTPCSSIAGRSHTLSSRTASTCHWKTCRGASGPSVRPTLWRTSSTKL